MKKKQRGRKPPPPKLIKRAAHMRCAGRTFEEIGAVLGKARLTIFKWQRKYASVWQEACSEWPIFDHKLAAVPLDAEALLHAYCVEKQSLTQILVEQRIPKTRSIRMLAYLGVPRRQDSEQVHQNTANCLDIETLAKKYQQGRTLQQLSRETGFSINTVRVHLEKAGVTMRGIAEAKRWASSLTALEILERLEQQEIGRRNPEVVARLYAAQVLYAQRHNVGEIALARDRTRACVYQWIEDHPLWVIDRRPCLRDEGRGFVPYPRVVPLIEAYLKRVS